MIEQRPRGMYFEEFQIGQQIVTAGRTITEADITTFAGLSGDFNQLHTDAEYAKSTPFGQRIAHGLLVTSIASGLAAQTGILEGTTIAFREISEWKFSKPVFIGDTVHVVLEVIDLKPARRLGGGVVSIKVDVRNQRDETVMRGVWAVIMASHPS
jgi:3-hydroxybutyryl-CoA dehydratase